MNTIAGRRPGLVHFTAAMILLVLAPRGSSALAESSPATKGPEVSTVGTGPYLGPLPEELAKLAQLAAAAELTPAPAKEPAAATITTGAGNTLTVEELAKLAALPAIVDTTSVPLMLKLVPMTVSKDGTASLTPQERDKRVRELATPPAPPAAPQITPEPASAPRSGR